MAGGGAVASSQLPEASQDPPCALSEPMRKTVSPKGAGKEPRSRGAGSSAKAAPAKVELKPKTAAGRALSRQKKCKQGGKEGVQGKQAPGAKQEAKEDLPEKTETWEGGSF